MVDWCVYLKADPRMKSQIRTTLRDLSSETQSINQTMTAGLRVQPIALNIETKRPFCGDDTADLQSAIWTGAGLARIRELLVANNRAETTIPTLSVVQMHGHDVHLLIFEEQKEENVSRYPLPVLSLLKRAVYFLKRSLPPKLTGYSGYVW